MSLSAGACDARRTEVILTPSGQALHQTLFGEVRALNAQVLSVLSACEQDLLDDMLQRMQREADRMRAPE